MTSPTLLVLAAGIGSRYGGAKQIDPVGPNDETVLDYAVYDAWNAGFGKVVFVVSDRVADLVSDHFGPRLRDHIAVDYVCQRLDDLPTGCAPDTDRQKPWGTGHAVWTARNHVHEPFAVINADDFYGPTSYRLLADFLRTPQAAADNVPEFCMVGFLLRNTLSPHGSVARGICQVDTAGHLVEVVENTKIEPASDGGAKSLHADGTITPLTGDEVASMNMWGFTPELFPQLTTELELFLHQRGTEPKAEFFMPSVVDTMIKTGRCHTRVLSTAEKWCGMTYRKDKQTVTNTIAELIAAGAYPKQLWTD